MSKQLTIAHDLFCYFYAEYFVTNG